MLTRKKPEISKIDEIEQQVLKAKSIKELMEIPGITLDITDNYNDATTISTPKQYKNLLSNLGSPNNGFGGQEFTISVKVRTNTSEYSSGVIMEQPATCANALIYSLSGHAMNKTSKVAMLAKLKAAQLFAEDNGYSFLLFTHTHTNPHVNLAVKLGGKLVKEYTNKRTGNVLSDVVLELDPDINIEED